MTIWAIADIHASLTDPSTGRPSKPMDVFGGHWADHVDRLERAWNEMVDADDTVIVAGDIDWGLHLEEAMETLGRMDRWSGTKILLRGNHDYWWSSSQTNKLRRTLPASLRALHNNAFQVEGFNICGTKGSPVPGAIDWTDQDEKILAREQGRLRMSLDARDASLPTVAILHYPPFYRTRLDSPYRAILEEHEVSACVFGHLHGEAAPAAVQGRIGPIVYALVSADTVGFRPVAVARDGLLLLPIE